MLYPLFCCLFLTFVHFPHKNRFLLYILLAFVYIYWIKSEKSMPEMLLLFSIFQWIQTHLPQSLPQHPLHLPCLLTRKVQIGTYPRILFHKALQMPLSFPFLPVLPAPDFPPFFPSSLFNVLSEFFCALLLILQFYSYFSKRTFLSILL